MLVSMFPGIRRVVLATGVGAAVVGCAGPTAGEILWPSGAPMGARIVDCPVADCRPLFTAAAGLLWGGGPSVTRSRLGVPVCGRDDTTACHRSGPIGGTDVYDVVLDRADGSVVLLFVQCWSEPTAAAVDWNGREWCQPLPNG